MATKSSNSRHDLKVGASTIDITPRQLPAIRNGRFLKQIESTVLDPLLASCIVLAAGNERIAITIVDSCMIPRSVCDKAKILASSESGIAANRILISATHTHSAPCVMNYCLGSSCNRNYESLLIEKIASVVKDAEAKAELAKIGWKGVEAPNHTHCRRWLKHPDHYAKDPFGDLTVRANMHPGYQNPEYICESGPTDPELTVISIKSCETEKQIALLANFSMHYFGGRQGFSSDYFGLFNTELKRKYEAQNSQNSSCVVAMSQGTSGDLHWMDYSKPERKGYAIDQYSSELAEIAFHGCEQIEDYKSNISLEMIESELTMDHRLPNAERLRWTVKNQKSHAEQDVATIEEVYAEQAKWLSTNPNEIIILQALRIDDLALTAIPNEVFGVTGLKLKAQSPFEKTVNICLANGASGYIPPPEQHQLGGYTTWPARTAGLQTNAEPIIVDQLLNLLEILSGKTRRKIKRQYYNPHQIRAIKSAKTDNNNCTNQGKA